jgi:5-methylthioadenosine/S-adenosylhomocysteine deaminase
MGVLIEGGTVLTPRGPVRNGAIAIEGNRIEGVGRAEDIRRNFSQLERLDSRGCLVIPGLVNSHTHCAMTLMRGYAEGMSLMDWLNSIWKVEAKLTPQDIELGAQLGAYEALLSGTTTLNSQYFYSDEASEVHAFVKTGIRAVVGHGFFERTRETGLKLTERMARRWHGADGGRIRISVNPHAPYSTGPDTYVEAVQLARKLNGELGDKGRVIVHTHVAEAADEVKQVEENFNVDASGGIVKYLDGLGVLSDLMVAAHVIHLSDDEVEILGAKGVAVALSPVSNLKLAMGVAPYAKFRAAGLRVGLGTDGPASNNSLDMFESAKVLSLIEKQTMGDPSAVGSQEAFYLATMGSARAIGWGEEIGALERGYRADVVILDAGGLHSVPLYDEYDHLVYSAKSSDVRDVFVDGRQLVERGKIIGLEYEGFRKSVENTRDSLLSRVEC